MLQTKDPESRKRLYVNALQVVALAMIAIGLIVAAFNLNYVLWVGIILAVISWFAAK